MESDTTWNCQEHSQNASTISPPIIDQMHVRPLEVSVDMEIVPQTPSLSGGSSFSTHENESHEHPSQDEGGTMENTAGGESDSDLSDEGDDEDLPPIPQPAFFYPHEYTQVIPPQVDSIWLTPEDDPVAARGIPVFKPTWDEFQDFEAYMESVAPWGHKSGIIKVIPPKEWTESLPEIPTDTMVDLRIKNPIQQNMLGRSGMFRQSTIEKKKALTVKDWWEKCRNAPFNYPGPKDAELRKRASQASGVARTTKRRKVDSATPEVGDITETRQEMTVTDEEMQTNEAAPVVAEVVDAIRPEAIIAESTSRASKTPAPDSETTEHDPWYDNFRPHRDWLPKDTAEEDYTEDGCRALERKFWRELGLGEACWYGADMKGSLFTDETTSWNVANLPNLLNRLNLKKKLPGVNTPYLYWGMWAAAFAWHVEDMDLYSINYIHFGAPKFWYAIPQKKSEAFERHMAGYFPSDAQKCDQFLRHKSFAVSPYNLGGQGSRPNLMVQKQGEFVITFPRGYHAGFNMGFNCAESINFALDDWIELGRRAKVCRCESENVHIDVDAVLEESALRDAAAEAREERNARLAARGIDTAKRQRKAARGPRLPKDKHQIKLKLKPFIKTPLPPKPAKPIFPCILCPNPSTIQLMPVHREQAKVEGLAPVPDTDEKSEAQEDDNRAALPAASQHEMKPTPTTLPTVLAKKNKPEFAHLACVRSTPELWVGDVWDIVKEKSVRKVIGVENIAKDRWNLKCASCAEDPVRQKHGSKIQCTKGKCVKAYHVTCAIGDPQVEFREMEVDEWVLVQDNDTNKVVETNLVEEIKSIPIETLSSDPPAQVIPEIQSAMTTTAPQAKRFERVTVIHAHCLCPQHNPAMVEIKKREAKIAYVNELTALPHGYPISLKLGTGIWGSYLLSINSKDESAVVTSDQGVPMAVKWAQIAYVPPVPGGNQSFRKVMDTAHPTSQSRISSPQNGAKVALTPQMISMLCGNPLLRASLKEIGLA